MEFPITKNSNQMFSLSVQQQHCRNYTLSKKKKETFIDYVYMKHVTNYLPNILVEWKTKKYLYFFFFLNQIQILTLKTVLYFRKEGHGFLKQYEFYSGQVAQKNQMKNCMKKEKYRRELGLLTMDSFHTYLI